MIVKKLCLYHFIPIYGQGLYVMMGYTPKEAYNLIKPYTTDEVLLKTLLDTPEYMQGCMDRDEASLYYIWLEKVPFNAPTFAVLNHEIFHVVEHLLDRVGMKHAVNISSEAYSYLTQYISEVIFTEMGKYKL